MAPSEGFYNELRREESKVRLKLWEKARFPGRGEENKYLCHIRAGGKKLFGIVVAGTDVLGEGSVVIPIEVDKRYLERNVKGLDWMSEENRNQFDPVPVAFRPEEALRQVGAGTGDLPDDIRGFTSSTNIRGVDLALEVQREVSVDLDSWRDQSPGALEENALGLAGYVGAKLDWKIQPLDGAKYLQSQKPISMY